MRNSESSVTERGLCMLLVDWHSNAHGRRGMALDAHHQRSSPALELWCPLLPGCMAVIPLSLPCHSASSLKRGQWIDDICARLGIARAVTLRQTDVLGLKSMAGVELGSAVRVKTGSQKGGRLARPGRVHPSVMIVARSTGPGRIKNNRRCSQSLAVKPLGSSCALSPASPRLRTDKRLAESCQPVTRGRWMIHLRTD